MNRAERRKAGAKRIPILEISAADLAKHMPGIDAGETVTITGRRLAADGTIVTCEPGQETPMRIEVRKEH